MIKRILILTLIAMTIGTHLSAQCYEPSRKEGVNQFKQKHFKNARSIFQAMKTCPDKPERNDINFWIKKCNQALTPQTKQEVETFAQKMSKYEVVENAGFTEGMMAVTRKADWDKIAGREVSDPYRELPRIGFINEKGDLIVGCKYLEPGLFWGKMRYTFSEGLVGVAKLNESENYWSCGYIDRQGREVTAFDYVDAAPFSEGLAAVAYNNDGYGPYDYTFIDKTGKKAFDKVFYMVSQFSEGLCAVTPTEDAKWGFINKQGDYVIDANYSRVTDFKNGLAYVFDNARGKYESAVINKDGIYVEGWRVRYEALSQNELRDYAFEAYKADDYSKAFEALSAYEKIERQRNDGLWISDGVSSSSTDWYVAHYLGTLYYYGRGTQQNYIKAAEYWKMVEDHIGQAASHLAFCYYNGYGVKQNYKRALECWEKAAEKTNDANDYYNAGLMYYNEYGTSYNHTKALTHFRKAKNLGHKSADEMLRRCKEKFKSKFSSIFDDI